MNTYYNKTIEEESESETENENNFALHTSLITLSSEPGTPKSYKDALLGPDTEDWKISMKQEIHHFQKRKAWTPVPRSIPREENRKVIPTKWVYKTKTEQDGSYRKKSRIETQGFHQIPGVDYTDSVAAVSPDSAIRNLIAIGLFMTSLTEDMPDEEKWALEVFDVEAAFLNADLENPIYIEWPRGMVELGFITEQEQLENCIISILHCVGLKDIFKSTTAVV